jgi:EPS-associated MarR family transcriptional regulator
MVEQLPPLSDETRYRLLTYLAARPEASQRDLARELDVSVGKINYCLRSLIDKGLLKIRNFGRTSNKLSYAYVLTPKGIEEKINVTYRFLRRKIEEYDALSTEIEQLRQEVEKGAQETQSRART